MRSTPSFRPTAKILFQADIEGHSAWALKMLSKPDVAKARVDLAERLTSLLREHRFNLLSWKGDGGIYTAGPDAGTGDFGFAVDAATAVGEEFDRWRLAVANRASLRLRISLHYADDVYVHRNHGYWSSDHLNAFIKYERSIGISGTIAITDSVFKHLPGQDQNHFRKMSLDWRVPNQMEGVKSIYYKPISTEAALNRDDPLGFFVWLRTEGLPAGSLDQTLGPGEYLRAVIGEGCILFAAPHPDSQLTIDLIGDSIGLHPDLDSEEHAEWMRLRDGILAYSKLEGKEDGKKVSAYRIVRPLSDIPVARVHYTVLNWSEARGFHELLMKSPTLLGRLSPQALELVGDGTQIPGIACCHIIVRTASPSGGTAPSILFCQRQRKGRDDSYHAGQWSLTCEEQMRPGEGVSDCVRRGLAEELLGSNGSAGLTIRILGAVLERSILNLSFIALVDVPLTLEDIVRTWRSAVDKDEHCQLTEVAIDRSMYSELVKGTEAPPSMRSALRPGDPATFARTQMWAVHPTTSVRMAFALWAQWLLSPQPAT